MKLTRDVWTEKEIGMSWIDFRERFSALATNVAQVVVAPQRTIRFALLGLFAQGHVLLEDLPGVGKTLLAKTIAQSIKGQFSRIQFTPDLLPTDITGTSIFDMKNNRFEFVPGPIFANVVLADELNRTGPRTQSALLEAMGEHQVTADGSLRPLPRPFMVIGTQNLLESYGTFPLPNSQMDRFLISMKIGIPTPQQEMEILTRSEHAIPEATPVLSSAEVVEMQTLVQQVQVAVPVKQYIVKLGSGNTGACSHRRGGQSPWRGVLAESQPGMGRIRRPGFRCARRCKRSGTSGTVSPDDGGWRLRDVGTGHLA